MYAFSKKKFFSIRLKLFLLVVGIFVVCFTVFLAYYVKRYHAAEISEYQEFSERHLETLGDSLLPYIMQNQNAAIHETLDAILKRQPEWLAVELENEDGVRLYPIEVDPKVSRLPHIQVERELHFRGRMFARLTLSLSSSPIEGRVRRIIWEFSILVGFLLISLLLILSYAFQLVVGKRLQLLMENMSTPRQERRAPLADSSRDEIGELTRSFEDLMRSVGEKQEQLREAKRIADEANAGKSTFLANMSHEIRTPLNGVIGVCGLLADTSLSQEQKTFVDAINSSGRILLELVNDILDFSKIEAGKMQLELVEVELGKFLDEVAVGHRLLAQNKGLTFYTELPDCSRFVIADSSRIGQIVNNLVSNALKFTNQGHIRMTCQMDELEDEATVILRVSDTGVGISDAALPQIFESFTQAETSTTRKYGGTGLGLAICRRLTELMGGTISVESEVGRGTTFTVNLSLKLGREILRSRQEAEGGIVDAVEFQGQVLVAEDNQVNQIVISRILKKWGVQHTLVSDGQQALMALKEAHFDLVLMDCQMPELDGYDATEKIRALADEVAGIPIVALTASATNEERERCLLVGMNDFLMKPIDKLELQRVLRRFLRYKILSQAD